KAPAVLQAPPNVTPVPAPSQPTPRPAVRESGRPEANLPQSGRSQGGSQNEPPPTHPTAPAPPAVLPAPPAAPPSWEKGGGVALLVLATLGGFLVRRRSRGGPSAAPAEPPGTTTEVVRPVADPSTARDPNLGRAFGRFTVQRVLGRGGCATAYFGVDPETGEEAAIKVPHPHLLDQEDFRARFHREAALGILLAHPRIVPMLDSSPEAGNPWLATRYIPGDTLSSHLHRHGPLGIPESVALAADVAEAIDFAHERGIVHRDLKPANIMVTPEGAMVMDFGIARITDGALTATTMFLGTPLYCAPEAVVSSRVGPAADWYALGIMLFEMVTGQVPFQAESSFQILESHRTQPLPDLLAIRPMTPPPLEGLIRRLCAKTPDERPSGREILETLGRLRTLYPPLLREAGQES
ncbi:MAG TPA: serine/threonine-protein kinase, partial [Holophagaceae bacterium]